MTSKTKVRDGTPVPLVGSKGPHRKWRRALGAHGSGAGPSGPPSGRVAAASRTRRGRLATGEGPIRPSEWARRAPSRPLESRPPVGPSRPCVGPTECPLGPKPPRLGHARGATLGRLGHFSARLGHFSARLGHFSARLGHFSARLGHFSARLGHSLVRLGHSFFRLGHLSGRLGRVLCICGYANFLASVQTRCTTHAAALLAFVMREALGSRPAPETPSAKRSVGTRRAASMQDTLPEGTARAAQLAPYCSPGRTAFVFWQRSLFLRKNQTGTSAERVHTYHTTQRVGCMVQASSDEGENYK
jgi:hypothetical protein